MRRAPLLLPLLLLLACADASPPELPAVEILVHGGGERHVLVAADARRAPLLAELDSLLAASHAARESLDRRALGLVTARGALEFRFALPQGRIDAQGDSLSFSRVLLALGAEPRPPVGESGVLLLLGDRDYSPVPRLSARDRAPLLAALEARARP